MAVLQAEEWGDLPLRQDDARDRLPQVMAYMGYEKVDEETWERRREGCGSGWWSLPDACPSVLRWSFTEVDPDESGPEERPRTRYSLSYHVTMPGQILAHTDAKALELEIDRILHLLIGGFDRDTRQERARLVLLTVLANLLLSLIPASAMFLAVWALRGWLSDAYPLRGLMGLLVVGGVVWGIGLYFAARLVVGMLNLLVETRLNYRSVKRTDFEGLPGRAEETPPMSAVAKK